jgi:hypothetical protein
MNSTLSSNEKYSKLTKIAERKYTKKINKKLHSYIDISYQNYLIDSTENSIDFKFITDEYLFLTQSNNLVIYPDRTISFLDSANSFCNKYISRNYTINNNNVTEYKANIEKSIVDVQDHLQYKGIDMYYYFELYNKYIYAPSGTQSQTLKSNLAKVHGTRLVKAGMLMRALNRTEYDLYVYDYPEFYPNRRYINTIIGTYREFYEYKYILIDNNSGDKFIVHNMYNGVYQTYGWVHVE